MSENPAEERYTLLKEYEEEIPKIQDSIEAVLQEKVVEAEHFSYEYAVDSLTRIFIAKFGETNEDLAWQLIDILYQVSADNIGDLGEAGFSQDFIRTVAELSSIYEEPINRIRLTRNQGQDYWRTITSEYVSRQTDDTYGMNHTIIKKDESVSISTDFASNISLVDYLIEQQIKTMEKFNLNDMNGVSLEDLERVESRIQRLKDHMANDE